MSKTIKTSQRIPLGPPLLYSTRLHLILFSFLLVATPFIMVRNYLQSALEKISLATIAIAGISIPIVPLVAGILLLAAVIRFIKSVTLKGLIAATVPIIMIAMGQLICDVYYDHAFYELQQNWHYFAYMTFAFMMYRDLKPREVPFAKLIWMTSLFAFCFSTFDEIFQLFMSGRVFDMGDISKDVWGALMGLIILYIGSQKWKDIKRDWKSVRHPKLGGYIKSPASVLILDFVLSYIFLYVSSLLTDAPYWKSIVAITIGSYIVFFLIFHLSQFRPIKWVLLILLTAAVLIQGYSFFKFKNDNIVYHKYGMTVYKGIPIPFFDIIVFPNGTVRPADKKHFFRDRDQAYLLRRHADIILIGSGHHGLGGKGFPQQTPSQFIFNRYSLKGTQVIILKSQDACLLFNRLKQQGKNVLFVLHTTC
ncbi:MAG: VanZ family protein [Candidatus Eisenbacteria bacterium]|uniref:VanZ family protein n=1 Tax=Eiseniibacteriota bacterium TaxID=2212470 RepID=A0A948W4X9_UNCEI|nr:VanZ family protein [Candidatus Eisenbacteria bacterium]MBU1949215.1 VanZ family protein [Candidatus Eisenbacteria bacterium]MBU2689440.1 VanZ family protein [Candidatus Eisenbacteria bacterium]